MVLNLGGYKFDWTMVNSFGFESEFGISQNDRILNTPAFYRANLGKSSLSLECKTLPYSKHGNNALKPLYTLANAGLAYALTSGTGKYLGRFVITKISENQAVFSPNGGFLAQSFSLSLEKVNDI